jgi:acyl-CoA synthetase (AMP-forming)/AMP-acid ligase II
VSLTFAEAHEASSRLAQVLVAHGIQPGDRVAIMLGNVPEWPLSWFAIGKAGAIAVPVNARYRESDLAFVLADSGAVLVLTSDEHAGLVRAVAATAGPVREVLTAAELARELADAPLGDPAVALAPSAIANFRRSRLPRRRGLDPPCRTAEGHGPARRGEHLRGRGGERPGPAPGGRG